MSLYIWYKIKLTRRPPCFVIDIFLVPGVLANSPGHLTFYCGVHIFEAIQRMVKRVFFSKKSYNLFLEFDTIICTSQLKVRCPGESACPADSKNVQDFYYRPFIS